MSESCNGLNQLKMFINTKYTLHLLSNKKEIKVVAVTLDFRSYHVLLILNRIKMTDE